MSIAFSKTPEKPGVLSLYGPTLKISEEIHRDKYRQPGENFEDAMNRVASALSDNSAHQRALQNILLNQRFLPAGRIQTSAGTTKRATLFNCFVAGTIADNFTGPDGIMQRATEAAETMRMGGGVGYDFSGLRPRGALIKTLGSQSSGPVAFMDIYDAVCRTVASSGHRRGAQMAVMRVDHPDIVEYVRAKQNSHRLTGFNTSVGVTDEFMNAVKADSSFDLRFNGATHGTVRAKELWDEIMRSTWDYAEPGVLFIDRMNEYNNLWYCETISATNPCSEQPLPPHGACLLGSFNLVKYIRPDCDYPGALCFDYAQFNDDIYNVVRAMDNCIDLSLYPLETQRQEALSKRRMGLGITGFANASEILGKPYGSIQSLLFLQAVLRKLRDQSYIVSSLLAKEKGPCKVFDKDKYLKGKFISSLEPFIQQMIYEFGVRNSHLTSIAPTGTISIAADNVSSGIEPVFSHGYERTIQTFDGPITEDFTDYAWRTHGIKGKTASECTVKEHLDVLLTAQRYVDSSISKTVNVGPNVTFEEFERIYEQAYDGGAKGLSTFRLNGKRAGILVEKTEKVEEGGACYIDPTTGEKSCTS